MRASFFFVNKFKLGFHNIFSVDCVGKGRGLAIMCKDDVVFEILNYSVHHIHSQLSISDEGNQVQLCSLTGVYGHPNQIIELTFGN